ncbi:ABC transporter ATP-binding protein [Peribacillus sp. SCS-37]|uniref:ABC transporter ATP-binding protein n=1 Tax=Paraperibacillus esterisolvens TaxID=3115296 RepID=UPI0039066BA8
MRRMFGFLRRYRLPAGVALVFMLVELAVELWQPLIISKIVDDGVIAGEMGVIAKWGGVLLAVSIFAFIGGIINSFYASHVSQSFAYDVRREVFSRIQSFSFESFSRFPASSLITRMTNDVTQVQNTVFMALRIMLRAPLLIIGSTIMAFMVNAKLALVLAAVIPLLMIFLGWVMNKGGTLFKTVQVRLDRVNSVMRENLTAIRLIKAFLRRDYEEGRFGKANMDLKGQTVHSLRIMETVNPLLLLFMNICVIGILWAGSDLIQGNGAKVGEVVAIVNYTARITSAFSPLSFIIAAFSRARASAARITEVLDMDDPMIDGTGTNPARGLIQGEVEFQSVSFAYPETSEHVLHGISFKVKAGETAAILGATGSGKTTLFQLIPRLYDASGGDVLIDGKPIRTFRLSELRSLIGYVPQEALLFTGTVKDNIAWGKENASQEEIIKAARAAQIHETIMKLPLQYDAVIGQKGVNLSGGQKQRLSIARALVRTPKILMLDDSTSALDLKTEAALFQALEEYRCTTFIITQKISTAMEADTILLLEDGALLAAGNHETLLRKSPLYLKIYQSQFEGGQEEIC